MNTEKLKMSVAQIECALDLKRKVVGVRFLKDEDEYNSCTSPGLKTKIPYCTLIRVCTRGISRKINIDNFSCMSAARALGMAQPDENWISGITYAEKGMYRDLGTAKKVVNNTTCINQRCYGVEIRPLEEFTEEPHVVIAIADAYNMMRLIQGYTYMFGTHKEYKIIGNQALCSECTAYPFESNDINLSTMCAGTRFKAGWKKDELGMGMPFHMWEQVVEGVWNTINIMETDEDKKRIEKAMMERGFNDIEIEYGKNYYTGCYR